MLRRPFQKKIDNEVASLLETTNVLFGESFSRAFYDRLSAAEIFEISDRLNVKVDASDQDILSDIARSLKHRLRVRGRWKLEHSKQMIELTTEDVAELHYLASQVARLRGQHELVIEHLDSFVDLQARRYEGWDRTLMSRELMNEFLEEHLRLGNYQLAIDLLSDMFPTLQMSSGRYSANVIEMFSSLAQLSILLDDFEGARTCLDKGFDRIKHMAGPNRSTLEESLEQMKECLDREEKAAAEALIIRRNSTLSPFKSALEGRDRTVREPSPQALPTLGVVLRGHEEWVKTMGDPQHTNLVPLGTILGGLRCDSQERLETHVLKGWHPVHHQ